MQTYHNKLVRDKIPEIIEAQGEAPICRVLTNPEYLDALNQKLQEEVSEYLQDNGVEELCDILEVIYAIAAAKGYTVQDLTKTRSAKNEKNGAFNRKIFLERVISPAKELSDL